MGLGSEATSLRVGPHSRCSAKSGNIDMEPFARLCLSRTPQSGDVLHGTNNGTTTKHSAFGRSMPGRRKPVVMDAARRVARCRTRNVFGLPQKIESKNGVHVRQEPRPSQERHDCSPISSQSFWLTGVFVIANAPRNAWYQSAPSVELGEAQHRNGVRSTQASPAAER